MITLSYTVAGQLIEPASVPQYLVADTVGVYQVAFTFDSDWADMGEKTVVFRNPQVIDPDYRDVPVDFPLDANGQALVPAALLDPGKLFIGVYGTNSTQQFPTIWAPPLQVVPGASPGVEPSDDPALGSVIRTIPQTLTEEEKAQARENIGANEVEGGTAGNVVLIGSNSNIIDGGFKATASFPVGSASGSIVTLEDGADNVPVKSMTVQIEPNQQVSKNDPSPSNILPIKGWTSAPVHRTRKNLWNGSSDELLEYIPSGTYDATNRTFTYAASAWPYYPNKKGMIGLVYFPFKENTQYTLIFTIYKSSGKGANMKCVYTDGTETVLPEVTAAGTKQTIIFTSAANKTIYYIAKYNSAGNTTIYLDESGVFEGVLTASDFEPYNGNTYEIEFPTEAGTVYGGELTVNENGSGTLTVDMVGRYLSTLTWTANAIAHTFNGEGFTERKRNIDGVGTSLCDRYKFYTSSQVGSADYGIALANSNSTPFRIYVRDIRFDTVAQFTESLSANDVFVLCPALNPVTYQLAAPQVSTLLGLNNIWADTGDINLEYHADPTIFVEEKTKAIKQSIAYVQDDFTAVQPYEVNDLVYVGDTLYIVTSAIAQAATMTPNTNCSQTTLNAVIKSLR